MFVSGQTYKISKGSNNYCSHCIYIYIYIWNKIIYIILFHIFPPIFSQFGSQLYPNCPIARVAISWDTPPTPCPSAAPVRIKQSLKRYAFSKPHRLTCDRDSEAPAVYAEIGKIRERTTQMREKWVEHHNCYWKYFYLPKNARIYHLGNTSKVESNWNCYQLAWKRTHVYFAPQAQQGGKKKKIEAKNSPTITVGELQRKSSIAWAKLPLFGRHAFLDISPQL